jgi:hypothetical protein
MTAEKVREDRIRRMLARQGYTFEKSRRRDPRASDFGRYTIIHTETSTIVADFMAGMHGLDDAEKWALNRTPAQDWEQVAVIGASWGDLAQVVSIGGDGPHPVKVLRDSKGILSVRVDLRDNHSGH